MFAHTLTIFLMIGAAIGGVIDTPEAHSNTTLAPTNTTSAPSNTTSAPATTTTKPVNATSAPSNTTSAPATTTVKPVNATSAPSNTTLAPATTTAKPVNATSAPSNTTSAPTTTTAKPVNATSVGNSKTAKPSNATSTTTTTVDSSKLVSYPHFQDVDPNELSCDPSGQVFLLLPSFTDCSKFYMCAHGEEVEFNCAPGTIFDFVLQTCNHPWATECILRTPKEDSETEGSGFGHELDAYGMFGEEIENGPMDFLRADSAGTVRPTAGNAGKLYKGPLNCQRADSASRQVAYSGDCQRYWHCVGAVPKIDYCSDGLLFNEMTQQCDFEANVKCLVQDDEELKGEFIIYK